MDHVHFRRRFRGFLTISRDAASSQPREGPEASTSSPQSDLNTYTQPIRSGRQFRLITLHPARNHRQRLECSCSVFDIDEAPPYEALSYVWGKFRSPVKIICNRRTIKIQRSLETALKRLRLRDSTRIIWADAICINQSDNAEKSHQVPLMGSIYSMAKRVVIWLGDAKSLVAESAFQCIDSIAHACSQFDLDNLDHVDGLGRYASLEIPEEIFSHEALESLKDLFDRPWFSRLWCVQEVHLAQDAIVLWGEQEISWRTLYKGVSWIYDMKYHNVGSSVRPLLDDVDVFAASMMGNPGSHSLLQALASLRYLDSSDPKDKVYGILNLGIPEEEIEALNVDYSKTVDEVFADTVLVGVKLHSRLDAFAFIHHQDEYDGDKDWRSWAPRWDVVDVAIGRMVVASDIRLWTPCGQSSIIESNGTNSKLGKLCLKGIAYSEVQEVGDSMEVWTTQKLYNDKSIVKLFSTIQPDHFNSEENGALQRQLQMIARTIAPTSFYSFPPLDENAQRQYYKANMHLMREKFRDTVESAGHKTIGYLGFEKDVQHTCNRRRFFWTCDGTFGLGPGCMRANDLVVVLHGGKTPYILRPKGDEFLFLGQAYVDAIMYGELMQQRREGIVEERSFCLI